jgi:excisionase family DNA binding protein
VGQNHEEVELPPSVLRLLRQVIGHLIRGDHVTLVPLHRELTTQEAADLLNVSRPYLVRLLGEGKIPYRKVGTHRRVLFQDLMEYRQARDAERRRGLARLTQESQDLGLYSERHRPAR